MFFSDDGGSDFQYAVVQVHEGVIAGFNDVAKKNFGADWTGRASCDFLGDELLREIKKGIAEHNAFVSAAVSVQGLPCTLFAVVTDGRTVLYLSRTDHSERHGELSGFMLGVDRQLREQLTNMQLLLTSISRHQKADGSKKEAKAMDSARRVLFRMIRMADNTRDIGLFLKNTEYSEFVNIDLVPFFGGIVSRCEQYATENKFTLSFGSDNESLVVAGDKRMLEQMLLNLLSNAILHNPGGGRVEIMLADSGSNANLTVKDFGRGMGRDEVAKAFSIFRPDRASVNTGAGLGLGLGLPLVQYIARMHGGVALIDTREGEGMKVSVALPRAAGEVTPVLKGASIDYAGGFSPEALEMSVLPLPN